MTQRPTWMAALGGFVAMLLLVSFYVVVSDAARSAQSARQLTASTTTRLAICGMRSASARDLCLLTAAGAPSPSESGAVWSGQTPSNSTSNIKVALGGITPPAPRAP